VAALAVSRRLLPPGFVTLLTLQPMARAPRAMALSLHKFLARCVRRRTVRCGCDRVGPAGQVTGSLAGGLRYDHDFRFAARRQRLAGDLPAHHSGNRHRLLDVLPLPSVVSVGLLPLLLFAGLLHLGSRKVRLSSGGGAGGLGRLGHVPGRRRWSSTASGRATLFTDVAGYAR